MSAERARDVARLDAAIAVVMDFLAKKPPDESHASYLELVAGAQLKAIDRLVPLLERRSKLLGLDAPPGAAEAPKQPGSLNRIEDAANRRLAAVPKP
jgi:hypothetical protein